jgi:hypothetical protein
MSLRMITRDMRTNPQQDWHRVLVGRAYPYLEVPYEMHGRSYQGIDSVGLILGVCNAIGRTLGQCLDEDELIARLSPIKAPIPGDVIYKPGETLGILTLGRNRVITATPEKGVTVEKRHIYSRKWLGFGKEKPNQEYDYFCLLRGVWHHGLGASGITPPVDRLPESE